MIIFLYLYSQRKKISLAILKKKKKILICPLDWGLGHATRCVPVIRKLLKNDQDVVIAADNRPLSFLEKEFPTLDFIRFEGLNVRYPSGGRMLAKLLFMYPEYKRSIRRDHEKLNDYIGKYKIDAVISDNRFGCFNKSVPSVYISHQLMIKAPHSIKFIESYLHKFHRKIIDKYDYCWVPDFNNSKSLSGDLANKYPVNKNYAFLGPLSRFSKSEKNPNTKKTIKILAILSGPEPQRSMLEGLLTEEFLKLPYKTAIVSGKTEIENVSYQLNNLTTYNNLQSEELLKTINDSELVICRSGYSSIMDLTVIHKKAIFIPTPGQTEQEYLANYHKEKGSFYFEKQKGFNLQRALEKADNYSPHQINNTEDILGQAINNLIKIIP